MVERWVERWIEERVVGWWWLRVWLLMDKPTTWWKEQVQWTWLSWKILGVVCAWGFVCKSRTGVFYASRRGSLCTNGERPTELAFLERGMEG